MRSSLYTYKYTANSHT